jgi:hypothetical protein
MGAGLSYPATHRAPAMALADARQARPEATQDQAVTTLAKTFADLHKHVRSVPGDRKPGMSAEDAAALTSARQAWGEKPQDHIAPARLAIGVIRDRKVRHRLNAAMTLPEVWDSGLVTDAGRTQREGSGS